jgi:uncharacterized protein (TIGR02284 family)
MSNQSSTIHEAEETLQPVIKALIDGQKSFQKFGEEFKDETLKQFFLEESLHRARFRGDLETVLHQDGIHDVKESGTTAGAARRTWGNLKVKLGGGDHALLVTAEQAEDAAKAAYKEALEKDLPFPVRQLLSTQAAHIQACHDFVKAARDTTT